MTAPASAPLPSPLPYLTFVSSYPGGERALLGLWPAWMMRIRVCFRKDLAARYSVSAHRNSELRSYERAVKEVNASRVKLSLGKVVLDVFEVVKTGATRIVMNEAELKVRRTPHGGLQWR